MATVLTCHLNVIKTENANANVNAYTPIRQWRADAEKRGTKPWTKSNKTVDNRNNDRKKIPIEFSASIGSLCISGSTCVYGRLYYSHTRTLTRSACLPENWMDYFSLMLFAIGLATGKNTKTLIDINRHDGWGAAKKTSNNQCFIKMHFTLKWIDVV